MAKTAINLYSVRDLDEPMDDVLDRVAAAGYDGVQFSGGLRGATPADVAARLDDLGLEATVAHVGIDDLEEDFEGVQETYGQLGCPGAVVPYLGDEHFESVEAVAATAERLEGLADRAAEAGWSLAYHNHAHEFVDLPDREETAFDYLVEATDEVDFELDVGWAMTGGEDPAALLRRLGDRVDVVHVKDMTADGDFAELGEGALDASACAEAAREVGASWLIYEHDEPVDPAASIDHGARALERL